MPDPRITIFDYGAGNLHSLAKAVASFGTAPVIETDPRRAVETDVLLLPGVGAFTPAAERLAPGRYKIVASVTSLGQVTQMPITTPNTVTSVTYSAAQKDLILELEDGSTVALSKVNSAYR